MAKPASRFKTVVRVKKQQEKIAQQQLVQIEHAHLKEREALLRLHETREDAVDGSLRKGRTRATDLQMQRAFIVKLNGQIHQQSSKVNDILVKANAKREELTERARVRQIVEKLEERKSVEAAKTLDRKEQENIDEVANRRSR